MTSGVNQNVFRHERLWLCLFCHANGLILRPNPCWQNHSDSQHVSALTGLLFTPLINLWESCEGRTALISYFKLWVSKSYYRSPERHKKNKSNQCSKPDLSLFMTKEKVKKKAGFCWIIFLSYYKNRNRTPKLVFTDEKVIKGPPKIIPAKPYFLSSSTQEWKSFKSHLEEKKKNLSEFLLNCLSGLT